MGDIKLVTGGVRELFPKHQFLIQVAGGWSATFQKMSELSYELAEISYHEGGNMIPWKIPGRATVPNVTLERGASTSSKFYDWMRQVAYIAGGAGSLQRGVGANLAVYMKEVKVIQLDRNGVTKRRVWGLRNCWPRKYVAGDWDASTDEVIIESLELVFDSFRKVL